MLGEGLESLDEQIDALLPRLTIGQRTARLGRDVRRPQLGTQAQRPTRVIDPNLPVIRLGVDERGVPVRLASVVDRIHHE